MSCLRKNFTRLILLCLLIGTVSAAFWSSSAYASAVSGNSDLFLTQQETEWLSQHRILRVSASTGWAPISFLDDNGKYRGIAIDYLQWIEKKLNLKFVYVHSDDSKATQKADIIAALSNPKTNTPPNFLALAKPFLSSPLAIYARETTDDIHSLEDLHGKKVAVFQSRIAAQVLTRDHPQIHLVKTDIADEALADLVSGKVEAYVGSLAVVNYVIRDYGVSAVKIVGQTPYRSELHMAVRDDMPELTSILGKTLAAMSEEDKNNISRKWTSITYEHATDYKLLASVLGTSLLVIGLVFLWGWRLRSEIKRRQAAEAEIERARGMLQLVLDTVPIAVFWQDKKRNFLGSNSSFAQMMGLHSPMQLVGKNYSDMTSHAFSDVHFEQNERAMNADHPILGTGEQIKRDNGSAIWVRSNRVPLHDGNGVVIGLLTTFEDVSKVRDSQLRNVAITEGTLECMVTIDDQGVIVDFNPAAEATFGYSKKEAIGAKMGALIIPPQHRASHDAGMERFRQTGHGPIFRKRIEITAMRRGGEEFPIELSVVPFEESGQTYFLGSIRDISERKLLEFEQERVTILLEETVNKLKARQLAMDQHASVTIGDLDGNILYVNNKFCEICQYTREELIGKNHSILKSGLHDKAFYKDMWDTIKAGKVWHGEVINRKKNGELYWLVATISPVLGENGLPIQYISVRTDITAQRKTEIELDLARARELAIGSQIQRTLLFGNVPSAVGKAAIDVHTEPSMGVDGDFYEFFGHGPDMFDIAIGDVMGKGIPAALIGAAVKQQLNRVMTEELANHVKKDQLPEPQKIINALHLNLTPQLITLERFVTMAYVRCDLAQKKITIVDAGHTQAIISGKRGVDFIHGDNLPLGVLADEVYAQHQVEYAEGDLLFLYSDGVTEAKSPEGEYFGEERLSALIRLMHEAGIPASIFGQAIRQRVRQFEQMESPSDDRTLAVLQFDRLNPTTPHSMQFDLAWNMNQLQRLRQEIRAISHAGGFDEETRDGLMIASFEVATNVLRHASQPLEDATLHCQLQADDACLTLTMYYVGELFEPSDFSPDFSGNSDGGFGLYIIKNSVDEVIYDAPVDGVCRIMLKKNKAGYDRGVTATLH